MTTASVSDIVIMGCIAQNTMRFRLQSDWWKAELELPSTADGYPVISSCCSAAKILPSQSLGNTIEYPMVSLLDPPLRLPYVSLFVLQLYQWASPPVVSGNYLQIIHCSFIFGLTSLLATSACKTAIHNASNGNGSSIFHRFKLPVMGTAWHSATNSSSTSVTEYQLRPHDHYHFRISDSCVSPFVARAVIPMHRGRFQGKTSGDSNDHHLFNIPTWVRYHFFSSNVTQFFLTTSLWIYFSQSSSDTRQPAGA